MDTDWFPSSIRILDSMRIPIQGAKPKLIHANPGPESVFVFTER
jgi:hypothetical protein